MNKILKETQDIKIEEWYQTQCILVTLLFTLPTKARILCLDSLKSIIVA
jgi:hypothetical protein